MLIDAYRFAAAGSDPEWASVVLLLACDGTNGSTTVPDASLSAHTTACSGSMALSTTNPKFGTASLASTGSSGDKLTVSGTQANWAFGTGDFTIECHFYPTQLPSVLAEYQTLCGIGIPGWSLTWVDDDRLYFDGSGGSVVSSVEPFVMNAWNYVGVKRVSGTVTIQVGSSVVGSGPLPGNITQLADLTVGNATSAEPIFGKIDNLRITKGVGRTLSEPVAAWPTS